MTELVTATSQEIEFASRDRISTLQLERMQWSLMHAYTNVPHYRKAFDDAGVHPSDLKDLSDSSRSFPSPPKRIYVRTIRSRCLRCPRTGSREFTRLRGPPVARRWWGTRATT